MDVIVSFLPALVCGGLMLLCMRHMSARMQDGEEPATAGRRETGVAASMPGGSVTSTESAARGGPTDG